MTPTKAPTPLRARLTGDDDGAQPEFDGLPEPEAPDAEADYRDYLADRARLTAIGRGQRAIRKAQTERESRLEAFLKGREGVPFALDGFDREIYLGTRSRRRLQATGEAIEHNKVMVRKVGSAQ